MSGRCRCGAELSRAFPHLGCLACEAACCPACAVHLESVTYCRACAGALLGTSRVRAAGAFSLY